MAYNVDLGRQLETFVEGLVEKGRYESASDVLRASVRVLQAYETEMAAMDAAILRGLEDADAGRVTPAEEVFARLEEKYRKAAEAQRS